MYRIQVQRLALIIALLQPTKVLADAPPYDPKTVIEQPFPPIVNARFVTAAKVDDSIVTDDELVLGVEIEGQARAYPINMICGPRREIINDRLGGRAIAATW
ncbi:MAG: DUF3179 domain-containing protein [Planctomycetales bacterium]|nr:DUF3179 domain-containing protein [Planctomycetales bacterium]